MYKRQELFQAAGLTNRTCDALVHTAGTLRAAGDHETALSTLEHAETLARAAGDELRRGRVLRQMGIVSSILGRHQHALSCLEEACQLLHLSLIHILSMAASASVTSRSVAALTCR